MKKVNCFCWIVFILISLTELYGQNPKIDSLQEVLSNSPESKKFEVLWALAYELFDVDNVQAVSYSREAYRYALLDGDTLNIVMSGRILGQLLRRVDKLSESIAILTSTLAISKRHEVIKETKQILNALAIAHSLKAEYDKALEYHFHSLVIREDEGNKKQISISLNNIGFVYFKLANFESALDYYIRALNLKIGIGDKTDLDHLIINIGLCYNSTGNYLEAQKYFVQVLNLCRPNCDDEIVIEGELGLGASLIGLRNFEEAQKHLLKSFNLSSKGTYGSGRFELENLIALSKISLMTNNLKQANSYLMMAERIPEIHQHQETMSHLYQLAAELCTRKKQFERANSYQKKYSELRDGIFQSEVSTKIMRVQVQFEERENLARIKSQSEILKLQKDSIQKQEILNALIGGTGLMILGFAIVLYMRNREKHRDNIMLDQRVRERTIELEKNRDELRHAHDEQEEILKRVASDLNSSLATIKGLSNAAMQDLPEDKIVYIRETQTIAERLVGYVKKYNR